MTEVPSNDWVDDQPQRIIADEGLSHRRVRRTGVKPTRRGMSIGGATLMALLLLAFAWLVVRGIGAVHSIRAARDSVQTAETDFRQGRVVPGQLASSEAGEQAARAYRLTNDPIWHLASHLPFVGSTMQTTAGLAAAAATLARAVLPSAGDAASKVDGASLRSANGGISLPVLRATASELAGVQRQLAVTRLAVSALPADTLVGSVGSARTSLLATMTSVQRQVGQIVTGAQLANSMLGADGPRRYFVALQNPSEVRGTGGLVGAYAIVEADAGKISLIQTGSDTDLRQLDKPAFDLGAAYDAQWASFTPYTDWRQANVSPTFSDAATIWLSLWQKQTGQRLDGVIGIDPEVAGAMLRATGATAHLPDGTALTGAQVADYTESTLYAKYGTDNAGRKAALVTLTQAIFDQIKSGTNSRGLLAAIATGVGQGRVLVASAQPAEEQQLLATSVGGAVEGGAGPFEHVVVNNTGGSKVDYYLDRTVDYQLGACTGATRTSTITVQLRNGAPATGLTPYVAGNYQGVPGTSALYVSVYSAVGSTLQSATMNGTAVSPLRFEENGRPSFGTYAVIKPGGTATLVLHLVEPSGGTLVTQTAQPLHLPGDIHVNSAPCAKARGN